jgi:MoaA/NifB/PqqE/SkfB family radical SAM enzyme
MMGLPDFCSLKRLIESKVFVRPMTFLADLTYRCNQECRMCFYRRNESDAMGDAGSELSQAEWERFLSDVRDWLGSAFIVFSGGEPLIRDDALGILEHSVRQGLVTSLSTNGTLIDEVLASALIDVGMESVFLSLEGYSSATHDWIAGRDGSFDSVINALNLLVEAREKSSSSTKIGVISIIMAPNMREASDLVGLAEDIGVDWIQFRPLSVRERGHVSELVAKGLWVGEDAVGDYQDTLSRIQELKAEHPVIYNDSLNLQQMKYSYSRTSPYRGRNTGGCRKAFEVLIITPQGSVGNCLLSDLGSIKSTGIKRIFEERKRRIMDSKSVCTRSCYIGSSRTGSPRERLRNAVKLVRAGGLLR